MWEAISIHWEHGALERDGGLWRGGGEVERSGFKYWIQHSFLYYPGQVLFYLQFPHL